MESIRVFFARLKSLLFGVSPEQESLRDFGRREVFHQKLDKHVLFGESSIGISCLNQKDTVFSRDIFYTLYIVI